jgi:hypothetical protein
MDENLLSYTKDKNMLKILKETFSQTKNIWEFSSEKYGFSYYNELCVKEN